MQNLFNTLTQGEVEYKDDGIIRHPPTATALRAARTIQELVGVNDNNLQLIKSLQFRVDQLLTEVTTLQPQLHEALVELAAFKENTNASVCTTTESGETSDVGSGD